MDIVIGRCVGIIGQSDGKGYDVNTGNVLVVVGRFMVSIPNRHVTDSCLTR